MPRPIEVQFAIPFALAEAAAEAYVLREPDGTTFSDFFDERQLNDVTAFRQFRDPEQAARDAGLIFEGETVAETVEHLQVDHQLQDLMNSANLDLVGPYRLSRMVLRAQGVTDPNVMPTVQASKKLGRQLGRARSPAIFNAFLIGISNFKVAEQSILTVERDVEERISGISVSPEAYERHIAPHVSPEGGCPMLGRSVLSPHTGEKVNLYDLYWEVSVAHEHAELERKGQLDNF